MRRFVLTGVTGLAISIVAMAGILSFTGGTDDPETPQPVETKMEVPTNADSSDPAQENRALELNPDTIPQTIDTGGAGQVAVPGDFAWLEGDLDALEARVAESLNSIENASPTASRALLQLTWLADEVLLEERLALSPIEDIARGDRVLAEKVVALPWLADDVQGEELLALESIRDIVREDPELARTVVDAPWTAKAVTGELRFTLAVDSDISRNDVALAQRIVESPAVADGMSSAELAELSNSDNYYYERIQEEAPDLADALSKTPWVAGSASGGRAEIRPAAALLAAPLPTDLTSHELWALYVFRLIAGIDESLALRVAAYPWLTDGISLAEEDVLLALAEIARKTLPWPTAYSGSPCWKRRLPLSVPGPS